MTTRKSVCYAYYGDGKFLGWYADSFGSVRPTSPKVYGDSDEQKAIITKNFRYKLSKLDKKSDWDLHNPVGSALLNTGLDKDSELLSKYSEVELRVVECPHYDGPNPDFDKTEAKRIRAIRWDAFVKAGIDDIPAGRERSKRVKEFDESYDGPTYDVPNWIYVDYSKVKEWASKEPTTFLDVVKNEK